MQNNCAYLYPHKNVLATNRTIAVGNTMEESPDSIGQPTG